jgi:hypothetical protein
VVRYVPLLIGVFIGVPLLAREHEQRTLLLAWSQDVSPVRWLWTKLALLGPFVAILTGGLSAVSDHLAHAPRHIRRHRGLHRPDAARPVALPHPEDLRSLGDLGVGVAAFAVAGVGGSTLLDHWLAGSGMLVGRSLGSAGAGPGGFRRVSRGGQVRGNQPKYPAHSAGAELLGWAGFLPRQAVVGCHGSGEVELGVGERDQPAPPFGLVGVERCVPGPEQVLLFEPEAVLKEQA